MGIVEKLHLGFLARLLPSSSPSSSSSRSDMAASLLPRFLQSSSHRDRDRHLLQHRHQNQKNKSVDPEASSMAASSRLLGVCALVYVAVDYLRIVAPSVHSGLQPLLWASMALAAASRAPFYPHWSLELRAAPVFLACLTFMLAALCVEAIAVQFVTSVLGLEWHRSTRPLPDTGQWLLLAWNERLPHVMVVFLRAHLIVLHHYLMLFLMLAFSVLFGFVKAPGLGLAARYMFTMGVGRLLRVMTFVATILPSARSWCAEERFKIPEFPHPWVQKFYTPYASDSDQTRQLLDEDMAYAPIPKYPAEYVPNWGIMQFMVNLLRPQEPNASEGQESWFTTLKRAGGGCNDLMFSGHVLVSVLTAMAWTEAYPGWTAALLWLFVLHTAQREIRERHHYSVDVVSAIYMGILLWGSTSFIWSPKDRLQQARLKYLGKLESRIMHAAKDGDMSKVRELLKEVENAGKEKKPSKFVLLIFAIVVTTLSLGIGLLAFIWTADG